jgi:putative addiction module CopG family antidote
VLKERYVTISLTPELDRVLNEKLASGKYRSVEEVLTAAFRALDEEEDTIAAITEGNADFEAGRYQDWETADAEFRAKHGIPKSE